MGRGKLKPGLIENVKARRNTFLKRKKSLLKKARELNILCDVNACIIIYGPTNGSNDTEFPVEICPQDHSTVERMVRSYIKGNNNDKTAARRTTNLSNYFRERKKKTAMSLEKRLGEIGAVLNTKITENKCKLKFAKRVQGELCNSDDFLAPSTTETCPTFDDGTPDLQFLDSGQSSVTSMDGDDFLISLGEFEQTDDCEQIDDDEGISKTILSDESEQIDGDKDVLPAEMMGFDIFRYCLEDAINDVADFNKRGGPFLGSTIPQPEFYGYCCGL